MGASQLLLALLHGVFPRRFDWKNDLAQLTPLNRQIFYVHTFFICWILVLMGVLCLFFPAILLSGGQLAQLLSAGCASFWFLRLMVQFFVYDSALWKGLALETFVHGVFSLMWTYYTLVFLGVLWTVS